MPSAPGRGTRRARVAQAAAWFAEHHPAPYPVTVRWSPRIAPDPTDELTKRERELGDFGEAWIEGRRCHIRLSARRSPSVAIALEALMHEWAHLVSAKHGVLERRRRSAHDDEFWLAYGRLYRAFMEDGGEGESERYPVRA